MIVSSPLVINQFEGGTFEFITTTVVTITAFVFIYLSLVLPISFWLGYKNLFYYAFILMAPIVIVEMFFQINIEQIHLHNGVLLIWSICMLLLSVLASVKLYEKREF